MAEEPTRPDEPGSGAPGQPEAQEPEKPEGKEEGGPKEVAPEIPTVLPLLPVRDIVIFPYMTLPL
ncbi:MAG: hypothetical protein AABY80_09850, partial [Candidatus Deferrimicrobiota bacterium]